MNKFFRILVLLFVLSAGITPSWAKVNKQTVTFYVDLHCQGCIDKIYKNIAFEKGVKDIQCDLDSKTVVVTFDADKTDISTLQQAFAAINKPASLQPIRQEHEEQKQK